MAFRNSQRPVLTAALAVLITGLVYPSDVAAQQAIIPLQLSFSDPGARSMGFGGAFVALADDATAAFANPAGLVQLVRPEISIETRNWNHNSPYTRTGRVEGLPSGFGLDSTVGLDTATSKYSTTGLSFLSFAWPRDDWSFALYRHVYADLEFRGETQGLFGGGTDCCQTRYADQRMASRLDIVNYGVSMAYRIGDTLDIGLGVVYNDIGISTQTTEYLWDEATLEALFGPNSFLPSRSVVTEQISVDGDDWTITAGFLWHVSEQWRLGGVYRDGPDNTLNSHAIAGQAVDLGVPPGEVFFTLNGVSAALPDIYGLGLMYRNPDGNLTVSLQWDRIEYSDIPRSIPLDDQAIDNADEFHLGAEYVFLDSTPIIALRIGAWHEPDHQMYATVDDPFTRAMLPKGDDDIHITAGLGVAVDRFQLDLAFDLSERVDTFSLSAIYSF